MAAAQATTTTSLSTGEAFNGLKPFRIYDERDDRQFYGLLDPRLLALEQVAGITPCTPRSPQRHYRRQLFQSVPTYQLEPIQL